jgi:hypothetical protein
MLPGQSPNQPGVNLKRLRPRCAPPGSSAVMAMLTAMPNGLLLSAPVQAQEYRAGTLWRGRC